MLAASLINPMIPTLQLSDTVGRALNWMNEHRLRELVVADGGEYLGMVSEDSLLALPDETTLLSGAVRHNTDVFANEDQHLYEMLRLAEKYRLSVIPVVDEDGLFAGTVLVSGVLERFANALGVQELGAVLVIKIAERDYSLSEVSRLIESNGTKVLSSYYSSEATYDNPHAGLLTLKLNRTDINPIAATLERYGYTIVEAHANDPVESIDQERFDMLLRYLET